MIKKVEKPIVAKFNEGVKVIIPAPKEKVTPPVVKKVTPAPVVVVKKEITKEVEKAPV